MRKAECRVQGRDRLRVVGIAALVAASVTAGLAASAVGSTFATARPTELILLANPGAESAPGLPGWSGTPGYAAAAYGTVGEYPSRAVAESIASGGPVGGGRHFFDPGYEPSAVLTQDANLDRFAARIADGEYNALGVTGWLGGWAGSPDTVNLVAIPLDSSKQPLAPPRTLAGPTVAERGGETMLVQRAATLALPPATRLVRVQLQANGEPGKKNHGYADEIVLYLTHQGDAPAIPAAAKANGTPIAPVGRGRFRFASVRVGRRRPRVRRVGRRLIVLPHIRAICPKQTFRTTCTIQTQITRHGRAIARTKTRVRSGARVMPQIALRGMTKRAIAAGKRLHATITVSVDQHQDGVHPTIGHRKAVLKLH